MKATIVTIGDEILIGQVVDTNSAWIAENLNLIGVKVTEVRTISDEDKVIQSTLHNLEGKVDLIIFTGGLGPTRDDVTKHSLNSYFGGKMVFNEEVLTHIKALFDKKGFELTELNRKQAIIPDTCTPLKNTQGTAPGMLFERSGTVIISLPGVPYEMKTIMREEVLPLISERLNGNIIHHRTLMTQGIPESFLAARISTWEDELSDNLKLAYLPRPGIVRLRLTGFGKNKKELDTQISKEISKLKKIIPEDIFAEEDTGLEYVLGQMLASNNATLATAESCTGGRIASLITSVPGSSNYFKGSVVSYSNEIKTRILGVPEELIQDKGAVSREVVEFMARNIRKLYNTSYSIAVSGVAGPSGGSKQKPVGTTWICVSSEEKCVSKLFKFGDHRGRNIEIGSITALNMLRKMMLAYL